MLQTKKQILFSLKIQFEWHEPFLEHLDLVLAQAAADVLLAHALDVQVRGSGGEFGTVGQDDFRARK